MPRPRLGDPSTLSRDPEIVMIRGQLAQIITNLNATQLTCDEIYDRLLSKMGPEAADTFQANVRLLVDTALECARRYTVQDFGMAPNTPAANLTTVHQALVDVILLMDQDEQLGLVRDNGAVTGV